MSVISVSGGPEYSICIQTTHGEFVVQEESTDSLAELSNLELEEAIHLLDHSRPVWLTDRYVKVIRALELYCAKRGVKAISIS